MTGVRKKKRCTVSQFNGQNLYSVHNLLRQIDRDIALVRI